MRCIPADLISHNNFVHPFTCFISGSSGCGKTTFCEKLITSNRISNLENGQFKSIHYFHPEELDEPPVDWAEEFDEIPVSYHNYLPTVDFFQSVKKDSLICFDDDFYRLSNYDIFAKSFRVFARKYSFSILVITQSYFEGRRHARTIRVNCDVHVLLSSYGDSRTNLRAARSLGYEETFKEAARDAYSQPFGHVIIFTGSKILNNKLRVQTGFFSEYENYCYC